MYLNHIYHHNFSPPPSFKVSNILFSTCFPAAAIWSIRFCLAVQSKACGPGWCWRTCWTIFSPNEKQPTKNMSKNWEIINRTIHQHIFVCLFVCFRNLDQKPTSRMNHEDCFFASIWESFELSNLMINFVEFHQILISMISTDWNHIMQIHPVGTVPLARSKGRKPKRNGWSLNYHFSRRFEIPSTRRLPSFKLT